MQIANKSIRDKTINSKKMQRLSFMKTIFIILLNIHLTYKLITKLLHK